MSTANRRRSTGGYAISPTGTDRRAQTTGTQAGQRASGFVVLAFILLSTVISLYDLQLLIRLLGR